MDIRESGFLIYKKFFGFFTEHRLIRFHFRFVKVIHNLILHHLRSDLPMVQGHKMFLDSKDSLDLGTNRSYEDFETKLVKREVKEGDVVLDIGAHIGYYTLIFAKNVGAKGKVFAFEPNPDNFNLLKRNVEINGYKNVVLIQKAVSNQTGKIKLFLSKENSGDHKIYDSHDGSNFIEIESIKLDDYFNDYNRKIDFIKMDIEGAEFSALEGMSNLLNKNKELKMVIEFLPLGLKNSGANYEGYPKLLMNYGFQLYQINEADYKVEPVNLSKLLEDYNPDNGDHTNLFCIKETADARLH